MDVEDLGHHISRRFNEDLEHVRSSVLAMGGLVEEQLDRAIKALSDADSALGLQVAEDDIKVNRMEVSIDEECSRILATRAPTASDLRLVIAVLKAITDLERIGDEAEKIARMAKQMHESDRLHIPRFTEVRRASDVALDMLRRALDAFARLDVSAAAQVVRQDIDLDDQFRTIVRQLITFMMEDPRTISTSIEIFSIAKALERIGDHAKNMAEYVIYLVKGKDVRHVTIEEIEREASA